MHNCYANDFYAHSMRHTEGVGFEPTVGFPTLDFESSALNRTQPPFLDEKRTSNPPTPKVSTWQALNVQHPTYNASITQTILARRQMFASRILRRGTRHAMPRFASSAGLGKQAVCLTKQKNVTN